MRKILTVLFVLIGFVASAQYTPSTHTPINKPIAPAGAFPTDARSYYYDAGTFTYRPYASTAEVLSYLNTTTKRSGRFPIFVTVSGVVKQYMFRDGTADGDLVEVVMLSPSDTTRYVGGISTLSATNKSGISWNITTPSTGTRNLDLTIALPQMVKDSVVLATPVANFYSLPVNSTIVVFRALTGNTAVDITTTGGVNSGTTARAGKPFIVANQDSVYKLVLSPYAISDSGTVNDVAPRSWVMIVPIATQWYKVAGGSFSQVPYSNANARAAISVTTTGTSGAATYNPVTGVLNIPNYATGGGGVASDYNVAVYSTSFTASTAIQVNLVNTTSSSITATVNPATMYVSGVSKIMIFKKITNNANNVIISPSSGLINGVSSYTLFTYNESVTIISDGTNLYTL